MLDVSLLGIFLNIEGSGRGAVYPRTLCGWNFISGTVGSIASGGGIKDVKVVVDVAGVVEH